MDRNELIDRIFAQGNQIRAVLQGLDTERLAHLQTAGNKSGQWLTHRINKTMLVRLSFTITMTLGAVLICFMMFSCNERLAASPVAIVEIADPHLRHAIRHALALPDNTPITEQEMLRLKRLSAWDSEITDLSGLEHATFLIDLGLCGNQIHDLRPLAGLVHLEHLSLCVNQIADISPLANLTNLKSLDLGANGKITNITPLANLTHLERINLGANMIENITTLANLTRLIHLRLDNNQIRDITPLANLAQLEELRLERNAITDIAPLIGLKNLKELRIGGNPIHDLSHLLEFEGVELDIDLSRLDELSTVVEVPDPNLKQVIREALYLPDGVPLTQGQMLLLTKLSAGGNRGITDLTGLQYATNLKSLDLYHNPIADISVFAHLTKLEGFNLWGCRIVDLNPLRNLKNLRGIILGSNQISDISPLAELTNLTYLDVASNYIVDFGPIANLVNLQKLYIDHNFGTDISPLQGLNLIDLRYDQVCDMVPPVPPVRQRIANRSFPSIVQAWNDVVGFDHLTQEQRNVLHDLHFSPRFETLDWDTTAANPTHGVAIQLAGDLAHARQVRQRRLDQNPNMVFLRSFAIHERGSDDAFPPNSDFWLRDAQGQIVRKSNGEPLSNFLKPEVQALIVNRIVGIERCGLYDGVFLDGFAHNGTGFVGRHLYPISNEEIIQVYLNIFRAVRGQVREDFLILVNGGHIKPDRYTAFINGTFMEILKDYPGGYTRALLLQLEDTLFWAAQNLREPRINCLEADGMSIEPPDGVNNLRWMRLFTTLSLTHSDGYVLYNNGLRDLGRWRDHVHLWHAFWDANLGRPVSPQAQQYQNVEGLFIREFTNGWAVYNRSGKAQTITLSASATPVSDRGNNGASLTHQLPDLDGEIYLTTRGLADVNGDGRVNILDLVQIANGFGKSAPDPNGDGAVNILDLVFVAQHFSE